jgi:hypothetical protein
MIVNARTLVLLLALAFLIPILSGRGKADETSLQRTTKSSAASSTAKRKLRTSNSPTTAAKGSPVNRLAAHVVANKAPARQGIKPSAETKRNATARVKMVQAAMNQPSEPIEEVPAATEPLETTMEQAPVDVYAPDGHHVIDSAPWLDGCGPAECADCCGDCAGCTHFWSPCYRSLYARGEYLMWWLTGDRLPPLATTSPSTVSRSEAGVLGQPDTSILFGNGSVNSGGRSGARTVLGWWLNPNLRVEGEWFDLGDQRTSFVGSSDGGTVLARPFFNISPNAGRPDANVIAYPGQFQGTIRMASGSSFLGAGFHVMENLKYVHYADGGCHRIDLISGFRYLGLYENLTADTATTSIGGPAPAGTVLTVSDAFRTANNFYGANIGALVENRSGRWSLLTIGRLGIGGTSQHVTISGNSSLAVPGSTTINTQGGLLALPTNIGRYRHDAFGLVPQLELKLGYNLTPNLILTVGYDLMYWNRVARPGEQIDPFLNTTQASGGTLSGTPGPRFSFHESDLWIQGISAGIQRTF